MTVTSPWERAFLSSNEPVRPTVDEHVDRSKRRSKRAQAHPARRLDIQGLRCLAVVLVVVYHAGLPGVAGGYVGVDVFFVISGYLITGVITRQLNAGGFSVLGFYANRARRLLPAALVTIIFTCIATHFVLPATRFNSVAKDGLASAYYAVNWRMADQSVNYLAGNDASSSPFQHFWSLAVEEQFYVVWPFLLIVAFAVGRKLGSTANTSLIAVALVAIPSFVFSVTYTRSNPDRAYFVTTTRAWELGLGAALMIFVSSVDESPARSSGSCLVGWSSRHHIRGNQL